MNLKFNKELAKVIVNPVYELVVRKVFPFGRLGFTYAMIDFSKYLKIEKRIIISQKRAKKTRKEEIKDFAILKMSFPIGKKTSMTNFLQKDRLCKKPFPIPIFCHRTTLSFISALGVYR